MARLIVCLEGKYVVTVGSICFEFQVTYQFCFFGAFAKLLKATISFVMSVCLSVCLSVCPSAWNNSAPTGRICIKLFVYLSIFRKSVEKNLSLIKIPQE
jgi:hypothetical protein